MTEPTDVRSLGDRIEQLLDGLQATGDRRARERAEELLRLVTELYGAGLARVMELAEADAPDLARRLAVDDLVGSLLLVHDLHPDALAVRVEAALESVRPFLAAHGGDVELLAIDDDAGAVQLRLLGSCDGCPSSAVTLQHAVQQAIAEAAPEIVRIDVDAPASDQSVPIVLGRKPALVYDPATGCGAVGS
ncbi:MAG TPA: NifU family protein [Acidimicrobiales bacterium]